MLQAQNEFSPKHWKLVNPSLHMQVPVVSSQVPWFEHTPSTGTEGQSNSFDDKKQKQGFELINQIKY